MLERLSVNDIQVLLDNKVNTVDLNGTLSVIQQEVERCVRSEDLKKSLAEQALVNEALCQENCLARWIWKSGDLLQR